MKRKSSATRARSRTLTKPNPVAAAEIRAKATDEHGAATYIGGTVHYLRKSRRGLCDGPAYIKAGWSVRYLFSDLDDWLTKHRVVSRELGRL